MLPQESAIFLPGTKLLRSMHRFRVLRGMPASIASFAISEIHVESQNDQMSVTRRARGKVDEPAMRLLEIGDRSDSLSCRTPHAGAMGRRFRPIAAHCDAAPAPTMALAHVQEPQSAGWTFALAHESKVFLAGEVAHGLCDRQQE